MQGFLNHNQLAYVLSHLNFSIELGPLFKEQRIIMLKNGELPEIKKPSVIFHLSEKDLDTNNIKYPGDIPVLFPLSDHNDWYYFEDGHLHFHDDLLKSAFYFLSGYQEHISEKTDESGRFPYEGSIQERLGIIDKPVVNYYFSQIAEGIVKFCELHNIPVNARKPFTPYAFFLTHDVDLIRFYTINNLLQKVKEVAGFTNTPQSKKASLQQFFSILFNLIGICNKKDPYWNFDELCSLEKELNLRSTFFFLHKDLKHKDSYYKFSDPRVSHLIRKLNQQGFETGIHGTIRSGESLEVMEWQKTELEKIIEGKVHGVRQHRLSYKYPVTTGIHERSGYRYDTSLGFAEHEGFRNSYCMPFKLYNFEQDRPFATWEIPLNVMDVTLFHYRKLDFKNVMDSIKQLIKEVSRFNGVFTFLWHNSHFNEDIYPGISGFYKEVLEEITSGKPGSMTGIDIVKAAEVMYQDFTNEKLLPDAG